MRQILITSFVMLSAMFCACTANGQNPAPSNSQDVINTIMTRTSIRSWEDRPVEKEKIETMLRAAMAAPTAVNKQPWHFVVLTERDQIDRLAMGRGGGMVRKAPLAIVVCGDTDKFMEGEGREYWVQDCSAATENLLLAAHALGLGAVWTGVYPISERVANTSQALGLDKRYIPMCTILIGYPHEQPQPKDKWKTENITWGIPK